ncbi:MAG: MFS transporter, partial [Actinomycetota bacterium]|nr:MFS transporter [Actinomycetota bacterium]
MLGGISVLVTFVIVESRTAHPLLDIRLFQNMRFSAAAISIMAAFFALFGFIFLITQFFQLIQGYSPLEAGLRTLPFAVATGIMSPIAIVLMHRFGSKLVVAAGLLVMSTGFLMASTVETDSPYFGIVVLSMITMAVGLALTTSPATESIMGALPAEKAGVGSAVNDTTREFGGTLGVAIIGSVFASIYSSQIADSLRDLNIPAAASSAIESSVGAGMSIAAQLPPAIGAQLQAAVQESFISGMSRGSIVAAGIALLGGLVVLRYLPPRSKELEVEYEQSSHPLTTRAVEA